MTSESWLFVSHVTEDRAVALKIVGELEGRGVRCWIAPRDVTPGEFDDVIADAIDKCHAFLLVFSDKCNDSKYIGREITVAGEEGKTIIPFRIEDSQPKRGLRLRLMNLHWIDAFPSRDHAIDEVVKRLKPISPTVEPYEPPRRIESQSPPPPRPWPRWLLPAAASCAVLLAGVFVWQVWYQMQPDEPPLSPPEVSNLEKPTVPALSTRVPNQVAPQAPNRMAPQAPNQMAPRVSNQPAGFSVDLETWATSAPDKAYCFQREYAVGAGQFLVRCFQNNDLCLAQRQQDPGRKSLCVPTGGLLNSPLWRQGQAGKGGVMDSWFKYSATPFPPPFPQF